MKIKFNLKDILNIRAYGRINDMYIETLVMLSVLEQAVTLKENLSLLIISEKLFEVHDLYPEDLDFIIEKMAKIGFIEKDGFIRVSSLGISILQSGQLKTQAAELNIGIQNIRLQWVLIALATVGIFLQVAEKLVIPLLK